MSKTTSKQRYTQLMSWLSTRTSGASDVVKKKRFSKADHINKVNRRYGAKSN